MTQPLKRWLSVANDAPNLLPNPGFEHADPADPLQPEGWVIDASGRSSLVRSSREPRTGRWALDAQLFFSEQGEGTVQLITAHPVAVSPGQRLTVGGSFLRHPSTGPNTTDDDRPSVWIAGRWLDTSAAFAMPEGEPGRVVGSFLEFPGLNLPESAYTTRRAAIRAPADADALVLVYLLTGGDDRTGRPASISIDDLFLRPIPEPSGRATGTEHRSRDRAASADRHRTANPGNRAAPDTDRKSPPQGHPHGSSCGKRPNPEHDGFQPGFQPGYH